MTQTQNLCVCVFVCVQLAKMCPEEYRQIIKNLETHYEEFKLNSHGSQMFADEDKRSIENQLTGAQAYYDQLVVQLPTYSQYYKILHKPFACTVLSLRCKGRVCSVTGFSICGATSED